MFDDQEEEKPVQNPLRLKKLMELIEMLGLMPEQEEAPEALPVEDETQELEA